MYKCINCDYKFAKPDWKWMVSEEMAIKIHSCPSCGIDDFEPMGRCELCKIHIPSDQDLCRNCEMIVHDLMNDAFLTIRKESGGETYETLNAMANWIEER